MRSKILRLTLDIDIEIATIETDAALENGIETDNKIGIEIDIEIDTEGTSKLTITLGLTFNIEIIGVATKIKIESKN